MRKIYLIACVLMSMAFMKASAQISYNPFTQNIHFLPEPTVFGYECGSTQQVEFVAGLTTQDDATQWQTNPLTVTVCIAGFDFNGATAASVVSGAYASNFTWAYVAGSPNCIKGTQNQTLFGTGPDPVFPNIASSGNIKLNLKVPANSPVGTVLSVNVTLQVPAYMATYNSLADDPESTQTQTFCNCYVLTNPGSISADQSFCVAGDPVLFVSNAAPTGGSGGTILYQWQQLIGSTWTDIVGATSSTYDAPSVSATTQFRRNAKRSLCGDWLSSNIVTVTIHPLPTADAGVDKTLNCTTTSTTIGTTAISGNTYAWAPSVGLSATNVAQPTTNVTATTNYTVTVTNTATGCTATDIVTVTINTATPTANAGVDKSLNCTSTSSQIGTASISGNTYAWLPALGLSATNIAQPTASPTATITYTVTVTGSNGCTATDAVLVTVNSTPPTANAGPAQTTTCTNTAVTIGTASVSGVTYAWLPTAGLSAANVAQPSANPSATTTYTVTATGSNGCTAISTVTVTVNKTPPTANAGVDKTLNCTTTSATIGTAAVAGNTYNWSPSTALSSATIAEPIASPNTTTTYTVTVTSSNGCTATDAVIVTVNTSAPLANAGIDKTLNCTTTSTTIGTTTVVGNTYSWSPALGLSATNIAQPTANPTSTTTYTVTVTGSNGCTATDVVVVNVTTTPPVADAGLDKTITCTTTSAIIGTASIAGNTYSWAPATALSATNIAQPTATPTVNTTYTVTVTGSNGCTSTDAVLVTINKTTPTVDAGLDKNLNCTTTSTTLGSAAISGNTYSWSPTNGLSSSIIAQPIANPSTTTTYTVTATGSNGCTATDAVLVSVNTTPPGADAGLDKNLNCTVTSTTIGSASVLGNTYSWSPALGLSSTTVSNPTANPTTTTNYTVTVTATNGCTSTDVVTVNVNTTLPTVDAGIDKTLTCTTTSTTIGTTAVAGNTYSWAPSTGLSATNIAQPTATPSATTTYTVTVTGTNGCVATDVVIVNVNIASPTADAGTDKNVNCTTTFATIGTTSVAGYTYSWSPSSTLSSSIAAQPIASPTVTTTYTVIVTGSNGCTASDIVVVNVNTTLPTVDAGLDKNLNCTTTSTTIGTASVVGNTYLWSPATALSSVAVAQPTANPTVTTNYTVTVTAANGCTATDVVIVNVNIAPPAVNAGVDKSLNCSTTSTTIGTTAVSGISYSWSPATALSSTSIAEPTANPTVTTNYTVTATGANGCTATDVVTVNVTTTPPVAQAGTDKNITCTINSVILGVAPVSGYTYSWSPATALSATNIAQPVANPTVTTNYTVTVTGTNGCTATDVVVVNVNTSLPVVDAGLDKNLNCTTVSTIIGTSSITGNTYNWSPNTGLSSATIAQPTASPSLTTTYTVTVTGSNGCVASDVVIVNVNTTVPGADAGTDKNLTCSIPSAVIGTAAVSGNTYSWNPVAGLSATNIAQPTASGTANTNYTVTVTGSNGCTSTDVVAVTVNKILPTVNAGPNKDLTCTTTSATIGTTALAGITYSWSPATGLSADNIAQPIANPSVTTIYTVTATGTNGCTATDVVTVNVNTTPPTSNAGPDKNLDCSTTFTTIGSPGSLGNTYSWTPITTLSASNVAQPVANPSVTTSYTLTVTGTNGCVANDTVTAVVNTTPPIADADVDKNINCLVSSVTVGTPAVQGSSYLWSPSTGLSSVTTAQPTAIPTVTTTYTVIVTGANGCTASDVVTVNVNKVIPTADAGPSKEVCSLNSVTIGSPNVVGYTYSWSPSTGLSSTSIAEPTASPLTTTTYTVTVTTSNGCSSTDVVTVTFKEGTIGNYVWFDSNADGLNNEPASNGLNGVTVQLYSSIDNVVGNLDDQLVQTTTTSNNGGNPGYYLFKICNNGNYFVKFPTSSAPGNNLTVQTPTVATDNNSDASTTTGSSPMLAINVTGIGVNKDNLTIDAGYVIPMSIGNMVWVDANNNGLKDATEAILPGATVKLYLDANNDGAADGASVETKLSDNNGLYSFDNLIPGNYIVGVTPPVVAGGTYYSSTLGEEPNPNSDVDNNDNGVVLAGTEIRSGTITLSPNLEPLLETPNNVSNLDGNNNLTIDFGFFVCPDNFVFTPIDVCANTTINLATLEPVGFTGGVWTNNNVVVTNLNVANGTYVYTYTKGNCVATGTQTVGIRIPDYAPIIAITPSIVYGVKPVRVVVTVNELLGKDACKPVYVFIPRLEPRFTFTWNPTATQLGSGPAGAVQNAQWQYFTSNPNFYIWKYIANGETFPANGQSKFGYVGTYDPNNTDGETTFSVQIFQGSGGENNLINNTDSELLIYYRQ